MQSTPHRGQKGRSEAARLEKWPFLGELTGGLVAAEKDQLRDADLHPPKALLGIQDDICGESVNCPLLR